MSKIIFLVKLSKNMLIRNILYRIYRRPFVLNKSSSWVGSRCSGSSRISRFSGPGRKRGCSRLGWNIGAVGWEKINYFIIRLIPGRRYRRYRRSRRYRRFI